MATSIEECVNVLKSRGYKITPQRIEILKVIIGNKEHPTAEAIYKKVHEQFPMISLATIYNTLDVLVKLGLIRKIEYENEARYDPNPEAHINLICLKCKNIYDFEDVDVAWLKDEIEGKTGFKIYYRSFEFYGICKNCLNSGKD